jgi:hypothetical protein
VSLFIVYEFWSVLTQRYKSTMFAPPTISQVLHRCVSNGLSAYLERVSNVENDDPKSKDIHNQISNTILQSSRLCKIEDALTSAVTKMLLTDARASGPTDPLSLLPYQHTLNATEIAQISGRYSLISIAHSDIGLINVTQAERDAILEHAGFLRAPCLAPCSAKRMNGRLNGISTYDVVGTECASIHVKDVFDMLSPGRLSLSTAVLTARQAGTKIQGGIDNYAYYECSENNPGAVAGENWQRCGGMFAIAKSLAEAWNASVQAYYRSPKAGTEAHANIQRMLFTDLDAQRVCAAISLAARVNPTLAEQELASFYPNIIDPAARERALLLTRHNAQHISKIPQNDDAIRAHVVDCLPHSSYSTAAPNINVKKVHQEVNGKLTVNDGVDFLWLAPVCRTAGMYPSRKLSQKPNKNASWRKPR